MKTFEELTLEQKKDAIRYAEYHIIDSVATGVLELELVNTENQRLLETILGSARKKESVRLAKLYLLGEKPIREEIYRLAIVAASGSLYNRNGQPITEGIEDDDGKASKHQSG